MAALAVDPTIRRQVMSSARDFHLMTRPTIERIVGLPMDPEAAVDELVAASLAGLQS